MPVGKMARGGGSQRRTRRRLALFLIRCGDNTFFSRIRQVARYDNVKFLEYLFANYDDLLEGEMTKIKSMVVSRNTCAKVAREMGLDELLRLGKGMGGGGDLPRSVIAAVYEALIGAIYLDGGLDAAREFILSHMQARVEAANRSGHQQNFKSVLQQAVQQRLEHTPQYVILDEKGPDHAKCFEVCVQINGKRYSGAWAGSKKEAEQKAALLALEELGLVTIDDDEQVHVTDECLGTGQ